MEKDETCCFTGHRPDKLPWGEEEQDPRCMRLKQRIAQEVEEAYAGGNRHFICGMARGCDLYFAEAVLALRERYGDVKLECARPCEAQADRWPAREQERYRAILDRCNYETLVQHSYDRFCMIRRNRYMVDRSGSIIAVYNGVPKGGTYQTLLYAMQKKLAIHTLNLEDFLPMNTLMHICCAPCANQPIAQLREEGISVTGFWFNPNIHPYTEYQARKRTLEDYAREIGMKLVIGGIYDLRPFITAVAGDIDGRCAYCYRVRMEAAAKYAAENGFDSFTTSLLISPYQNHEAIAAAAREMGEKYGVEFLYRDFRPLFQEGQRFAREHGFYMQKYCGCIFSEEDRYMAAKRKKKAAAVG